MLGYTQPDSTTIRFTRAIFLKTSILANVRNRVKAKTYKHLETYDSGIGEDSAHAHAYNKLAQAYSIMSGCVDRENQLTKRWKVTSGALMSEVGRGSIWEGYGARVSHAITLSGEERKNMRSILQLDTTNMHWERVRREAEINAMLEDDYDAASWEDDELEGDE
jgi:hypothetical protein